MEKHEARIDDEGKLVLPEPVRRALGVADGDTLTIELDEGHIRLRASDSWIDEARAMLKPYLPSDGRLLSDELIADRRAEAARDEWEYLRDVAEYPSGQPPMLPDKVHAVA